MKTIFCALFILLFSLLCADPWGKDADLVDFKLSHLSFPPPSSSSSPLLKAALGAIRFHQEIISPADGPRSHYIPSSSQYTLEAMKKYGFLKGYLMGCDRLMRENDEQWVYRKTVDPSGYSMKWDPVP